MSRHTCNNDNNWNETRKPTSKTLANRRKNARRMEKNERLREQYPQYRPATNVNIIHIIEQLIGRAKETHRYTIDTELQSSQSGNIGPLVQIEMVHSCDYSTVLLLETFHFPDANSSMMDKIKQLWSIIFNSGDTIITWGAISNEFKDFHRFEWMKIGKIIGKNLQALFQDHQDEEITHLERESREMKTRVSYDTPGYADYNDDDDENAKKIKYSLQTAVEMTLKRFIDKSLTRNSWGCGLDWELGTWRWKTFQTKYYDMQLEKQTRLDLINYAAYDCTSVTEIYSIIYLGRAQQITNQQQTTTFIDRNSTPKTTSTNHYYQDGISDVSDDEIELFASQTQHINDQELELNVNPEPNDEPEPTKRIKTINNYIDDMVNISEDELIEILKPKFDPKPQQQTTTIRLIKQEKQKKKNEKLKWKRKYQPNFQNYIIRPIYNR